ncbi:hypothetical protein QVD17_28512 [Tagetes erecta]|uniref:Pre-mRNA-splicing factor SYF2 n=1 Tax=Tagetes erecta TaxID=13708 RepID=A0AAD8KDH5_TARER|nr:hypothetical protein QVD17_28512 [Tagetes erecta]
MASRLTSQPRESYGEFGGDTRPSRGDIFIRVSFDKLEGCICESNSLYETVLKLKISSRGFRQSSSTSDRYSKVPPHKLAEIFDTVNSTKKMTVVHPDCRNSSNPYHECSEYCFKFIADAKKLATKDESVGLKAESRSSQPTSNATSVQTELPDDEKSEPDDHPSGDDNNAPEDQPQVDLTKLTGKQKKLFEIRLKMNEARKANQRDMVAEKKRNEGPQESRGISKQKWLDERKKKIGRLLEANGLDMKEAYMLDTQQMAEMKYKKWDKDPAPAGWDVFNQKTLYEAHKKRTKKIDIDLEEYNKMKEADPEFYREASSLQYGKAPKVSDERIEKMVKELKDKDEKRNAFSRRRKFHEDKDIDSINDRNEHFNKKIERAFGRYTLEIKNNLERGTALPD